MGVVVARRGGGVRRLAGTAWWCRTGTAGPTPPIARRFGSSRAPSVAGGSRRTARRGLPRPPPAGLVAGRRPPPGSRWPGPTIGPRPARFAGASATGRTGAATSSGIRRPPPQRETHNPPHRTGDSVPRPVYALRSRPPSRPARRFFGSPAAGRTGATRPPGGPGGGIGQSARRRPVRPRPAGPSSTRSTPTPNRPAEATPRRPPPAGIAWPRYPTSGQCSAQDRAWAWDIYQEREAAVGQPI